MMPTWAENRKVNRDNTVKDMSVASNCWPKKSNQNKFSHRKYRIMETTKPTIEDMNKLIAEFMGETITDSYNDERGIWVLRKDKSHIKAKVKYHESWDWLMPVCKKLFHLYLNGNLYEQGGSKTQPVNLYWNDIEHAVGRLYDIEKAHAAVYNFIAWYNGLNKSK
jgi:hypothetical protein